MKMYYPGQFPVVKSYNDSTLRRASYNGTATIVVTCEFTLETMHFYRLANVGLHI